MQLMACIHRHKRCDIFSLENYEYGLVDVAGCESGDKISNCEKLPVPWHMVDEELIHIFKKEN